VFAERELAKDIPPAPPTPGHQSGTCAAGLRMEGAMDLIGPVMSVALMVGVQTSSPPSVTGTPLRCGSVTGRTTKDRDDALRFCSDEITLGIITEVIADDSVVRILVTTRLADAMREDRVSAEELVTKWLRWWCTVTDDTAVTLVIESNSVEVVRGSTAPDRDDRVTWPRQE
jgi:hypothetical protein